MKEIGVRKVLGASALNITRVIIQNSSSCCLFICNRIGAQLLAVEAMMDSIWDYYQAAPR